MQHPEGAIAVDVIVDVSSRSPRDDDSTLQPWLLLYWSCSNVKW
jgi:hypothetical protein